jgi:hypothetical protein
MSSRPVRSHWWPRTLRGRVATIAFLGGMLLAQPPLVFQLANRVEPWILGLPFLYAYLSVIYAALLALLLMIWRWRL